MLRRCLLWLGWLAVGVAAGQRKVDTYILAIRGANGMVFNMRQRDEFMSMEATISTQLSELIVVDKSCGMRKSGCPRYCNDLDITEVLCEIDCQHPSITSPMLACADRRYDSELSAAAVLINRNWTNRLAFSRRLVGDLRSDIISVNNWKGRDNLTASLRLEFVSARWFDSRVLRAQNAVFGLKPGAHAAIPQLLRFAGAETPILTLSAHQPNSPLRHLVSPHVGMYLNLGVVDRVHCTNRDFVWADTEDDFMLKVPKVNFMGVEFVNVVLTFDLATEVFVLSSGAARHLESLHMITPFFRMGFADIFMYNCTGDPPIQFLDADGRVVLELRNEELTYNTGPKPQRHRCPTLMVLDNGDPYTWPRYSDVWHLGTSFLRTHCLAYDYSTNRIGFGEARRWAHPYAHVGQWE